MRKSRRCALLLIMLLCAVTARALATGSWGQINQDLGRPEYWQAIVTDSEFVLGEATALDAEAEIPYFERGFGSYPSLDGSTVAVPMALEFAR